LQEESEQFKQSNISYKSDLALLTEKLRLIEDQEESFRNVRMHIP
jgi:hypothetical protein